MQMHANKQNPLDRIEAGDIGAAVGFKEIRTGDTLCDLKHPLILEAMTFPEPVIGIAVEPKSQADIDKLSMGLSKLAEEDPTFKVKTDVETGQTVIHGMGELHLDILVDRLKREFNVECNLGKPEVAYKEAIISEVKHREVYKKQSGGRGKFADVEFRLGPADEGVIGLQFIDEVKGGNIPREYIPSIQKGFQQAMANGVLAGYPVDSLKVTVLDGSYHAVDSDSLSFEICAKIGYKTAGRKAKSVLLEPIMKVEILSPEANVGDIMGDLNKRRAIFEGIDTKSAGVQIIKVKVPLANMFGYVTTLRTLSSGRASSSMEFSHFDRVPDNISEEVILKAKGITK